MSLADSRPLVERLRSEAILAAPGQPVTLIETHISWVFLAGEFAWKLKKPVDLGFVDFTTLARREHFCREELRLNRRFNPHLYLHVRPIVRVQGELRLGSPDASEGADVVDWVLQMRAFEPAEQLDVCLDQGRLTSNDVEALGTVIARLHDEAPVADNNSKWGNPAAALARTAASFDSLRGAAGQPVDLARLDLLAERAASAGHQLVATLQRRRDAGRVRECHGDLHLSNIVRLPAGILPFDCIEFDADLRWIDVVADVAFALMDLQVRNRLDLATQLLNSWLVACGDYDGLRVLRYFTAYRSMVRAMVAGLQVEQGVNVDDSRQRCLHHFDLAEDQLRDQSGGLVLMCGLSGSGKSWLAARLSPLVGAAWLRSDVERKRIYGLAARDRRRAPPGGGLYSQDANRVTGQHLRACAQAALDGGVPMIVDATFIDPGQRADFAAMARAAGAPAVTVYCSAPVDILRKRIRARAQADDDPSDATEAVLDLQLQRFVPPVADHENVLEFGPNADVGELAGAVRRRLSIQP